MARRLSYQSRANLKLADRAAIVAFDSGRYGVRIETADGQVGYLCGGDGFVMTYCTPGRAEAAVTRSRPDLRPTLG